MWGRGYLPSSHIFPLKNGKKFALNWGTTVNVVNGGAHGKVFLRGAKNTETMFSLSFVVSKCWLMTVQCSRQVPSGHLEFLL